MYDINARSQMKLKDGRVTLNAAHPSMYACRLGSRTSILELATASRNTRRRRQQTPCPCAFIYLFITHRRGCVYSSLKIIKLEEQPT